MPVITLNTRTTRAALRQAISAIPQGVVAGEALTDRVLTRCGAVLLNHIRREYIIKAQGGTDQAGYRWAPLKTSTIAYRKSNRSLVESSRRNRPSQAMTRKQQQRWWDLYRQGLAIYKGNKAAAAKRAWAIMKASGVKTLFDRYASKQVRILYDSGKLYNSIHARVGRGEVSIRSDHKAAPVHHYGSPRKGIPQRRLWPEPRVWPQQWWKDIIKEVEKGIMEATLVSIRSNG